MTTIQRWFPEEMLAAGYQAYTQMEEHFLGDYVLFSDHQARIEALEAKLAKAVGAITCILATADSDDHVGWQTALDDARAAIPELETNPCGKRVDPIVVDLKIGWFEPK